MGLFRTRPSQYSSTDYETIRNLIRSRERQRQRAARYRRRLEVLEERLRQQSRQHAEQQQAMQLELQLLECRARGEQDMAASNPLLSDLPIPGHHFGVKLIALAIELFKQIGLRPAERALQTIFKAVNLDLEAPSHDAIRNWTLRLGVSELENPFREGQEVLWMADHSSQIGAEKVLLIIGIALEDLPPPGQTLALEDVNVLAIIPGQHWKKEDVEREYQKLAGRIGAPRYLLCDGASELRDPAENLEKDGRRTVVLGDLKHHAANVLEKQLGRSERFKAFLSQIGLTRNRIQQTELSHFVPPPLKQKSRFMNLGPLLRWAEMVLYHLAHPESNARVGITAERMEQKLGWLEEYREDIALWNSCERLVGEALHLINHEGLSRGSSARLRQQLIDATGVLPVGDGLVENVARSLVAFVKRAEERLDNGQRAWLSTEIIESLFGRFKQLEGQHSKGGFTSLLAALPTLCCRVDGARVRDGLSRVSTPKLKQWISATISQTLTARRTAAYQELARCPTG